MRVRLLAATPKFNTERQMFARHGAHTGFLDSRVQSQARPSQAAPVWRRVEHAQVEQIQRSLLVDCGGLSPSCEHFHEAYMRTLITTFRRREEKSLLITKSRSRACSGNCRGSSGCEAMLRRMVHPAFPQGITIGRIQHKSWEEGSL